MTVPVAVDAFVPDSVAVSLTAVLSGTEMLAPDWPPPDRLLEVVVAVVIGAPTAPMSQGVGHATPRWSLPVQSDPKVT